MKVCKAMNFPGVTKPSVPIVQEMRLPLLRAELAKLGLDGFLVPRSDAHLGEYVPLADERLAWLAGFTGSAGLALVLPDRAAVFTDGRYQLQLATEIDPAQWEALHITETPPAKWLAAATLPTARVGYDPRLISEVMLAQLAMIVTLVPVGCNPIDALWTDRPTVPAALAVPHPLHFAGIDSTDKLAAIAAQLRDEGNAATVLTDPASINWLLNIRGGDVPFTPFVLCFALVHDDARCDLFINPEKRDATLDEWLGPSVSCYSPELLSEHLQRLGGQRVRLDRGGAAAWFGQILRAAGAELIDQPDPCLLPKASKNAIEQQGARAAHRRDGAALCRFLHWLETAAPSGEQTEASVAAKLRQFRAVAPEFRGESFPAISGAGENAAIIHYRVTHITDRTLQPNEIYLIDSGGQYLDGTTDITRTLWTGPNAPPAILRDRFTRVLQGHIAIASLIFPEGLAGPHLDAFARVALWRAALDYDHGTGHGVGSYLSVHEGPAGISRAARIVPLQPGMILSNEPGCYQSGVFGMRLENLLLVQLADFPGSDRPFLCFETLSYAPFDRRLIDTAMLNASERQWLDCYHAEILAKIVPAVNPDVAAWLDVACAPLQ